MKTLNNILITLICLLIVSTSIAQSTKAEKLHHRISSDKYDEIAPCVSPDGLTMYFTRTASPEFEATLMEGGKDLSKTLSKNEYQQHLSKVYSQLAGKSIANPTNSVFNQDIWIAQTAVDEFDILLHPKAPLNNALPNSISALMPSSNEVILINQFVEKGGMKKGFSKSKRNADGTWDFPKPISINNFHNSGTDVNLSISQDGKVMIMALERNDAFGRSDLYICFKQNNGSWSTPQNLGRGVNTPFREATPHLSSDMRKLYFSSDRGGKSGKSNIYVQKRMGEGWDRWSAPQKFRGPINSTSNDSHPYFCQSTGHLYFSSDRDGSWDIYRMKIAQAKPKGLIVTGQLFNENSMELIDALVVSGDGLGNKIITSSRNGCFRLLLTWNQKIKISARKKDFKEAYTVIATGPAMKTTFVKEIKLLLEPLEPKAKKTIAAATAYTDEVKAINLPPAIGAKLQLDHIYFQQSTANVLKKSYPAMDKLSDYLRKHSDLTILIAGHTDNNGDKTLIKKLSVDRAIAIKSYLVGKKSINADRIKTIGYGAEKPLNDNSTERLRKMNRRVEIEIIGKEDKTSDLTKTK